jgi:F-type H+-transporting ATPase subunit epsilon
MPKFFNLSIIDPVKVRYEGKVSSLIAPSALGYLGVLADHAPLVAKLVRGKLVLKEESGATRVFGVQGKGFLEVVKNNVTVLLSESAATT